MANATTAPKPLSQVTIGTADGAELTGHIGLFSPQRPDLDVHTSAAGRALLRTMPVENVTYVAFHGTAGDTSGVRSLAKARRIKVKVTGGRAFSVEVDAGALINPVGFFAIPLEAGGPYQEIFFYAHGVVSKEEEMRLGDMLVERKAVEKAELARGVAAQEARRKAPLGQILVEQAATSPEVVDQAVEIQRRKRLRIGEVLLEAGWITKEQLERALDEQKRRRGLRLGEVLVELGVVGEEVLTATLASKFLLPVVDLDRTPPNRAALGELPRALIERYGVLPVDVDGTSVTVAITDPLATDALEAVRFQVRKRVREVMVLPSQLRRHIAETLARLDGENLESNLADLLREMEASGESTEATKQTEVAENDSTVIRLVNRILLDAYKAGASDIHIEPNGGDKKTVVRFRADGDCFVYQELPGALRKPVVARIKIMAHLDISERRKPQDGKISLATRTGKIELRVATLPTVGDNEDVVLRLLASSKPLPLERLDLSDRNLTELRSAVKKPYGLFLVVGPTGSGKTTTLHSILGHLNTPDTKIWTAEDPVEITQDGLRQVQMQPKIGLTFATALRSFLRADPDVIMVGEMRDQETASIGVEASLTGHLVLSTLHTNSAPETIVRLVDMGLDPFSFADALVGVLAQRLARRLCVGCRKAYEASREEITELEALYGADALRAAYGARWSPRLYRSSGCSACNNTGYRGRVALHELLVADDPLKRAIGRRAPVAELRATATSGGMTTLVQDGVDKCLLGLTDLKQVLAVAAR